MEKKYVINLSHRTDRWEKFKELNNEYLEDIERIPGTYIDKIPNDIVVKLSRPAYHKMSHKNIIGNLLSHINILKNNLDNDHDIIVFEDDCYITKEGKEYYDTHKCFIPDDCDIFMLSSVDNILPVPVNRYVFRTVFSCGLHSILYKNSSKRKIISLVENYLSANGYNLLDNIFMEIELNVFTFLKNYTELYESPSDVVLDEPMEYGIRYKSITDINDPSNNIIEYYYVNEKIIKTYDIGWLSQKTDIIDYNIKLEEIRVINLTDRSDRWEKFKEKNDKFNIPMKREDGILFWGNPRMDSRYKEIYGNKVSIAGILESHIKILEDSLWNEEDIIVFEDDCAITEEGLSYFETHKKYIPKDFDIFLLSSYESTLPSKVNDFVFRARNSMGLHSVLYNGKKKKFIVEAVRIHIFENGYYPLDLLYYDIGVNIYKFLSNLTELHESYSDNFKKIMNHTDIYLKYSNIPDIRTLSTSPTIVSYEGQDIGINLFKTEYIDPDYSLIERNGKKIYRHKSSTDEINPAWEATVSPKHTLICKSTVKIIRNYKYLPFKFETIYGDFILNKKGLVSYKGSPRIVKGDFYYNDYIIDYPPTITMGKVYSNQPNFILINDYIKDNIEKFMYLTNDEFIDSVKSLDLYKVYYYLEHFTKIDDVSSIISNYFETYKNVCVIDIGSNSDYTNTIFKEYSKHGFDLYSIEPIKNLYELLINEYGNTDIKFLNFAVSTEENKNITMYGVKKPSKNYSWVDKLYTLDKAILLSNKKYIPQIEELVIEEQVDTITFDILYDKYISKKINLIVIDTEGHDYIIFCQMDIKSLDLDILVLDYTFLSKEELSDIISKLFQNYEIYYDMKKILAIKKSIFTETNQ